MSRSSLARYDVYTEFHLNSSTVAFILEFSKWRFHFHSLSYLINRWFTAYSGKGWPLSSWLPLLSLWDLSSPLWMNPGPQLWAQNPTTGPPGNSWHHMSSDTVFTFIVTLTCSVTCCSVAKCGSHCNLSRLQHYLGSLSCYLPGVLLKFMSVSQWCRQPSSVNLFTVKHCWNS